MWYFIRTIEGRKNPLLLHEQSHFPSENEEDYKMYELVQVSEKCYYLTFTLI